MTEKIETGAPAAAAPRPAGRAWLRQVVATAVSFGFLGAIYWRIDLGALGASIAGASIGWILIAIVALLPALALTTWRLTVIARPHAPLSFGEAAKLVLIAHSLNMVLPSRLGDFAKAHAMAVPGTVPVREALSVVIIEKTWDALAVMFWCAVGVLTVRRSDLDLHGAAIAIVLVVVFGLLVVASQRFAHVVFAGLRAFAPHRSGTAISEMETVWTGALAAFWRDRRRAAQVIGVTVVIWFIHLVEIWLFILAVGVNVPFLAHLGLAPLVMMASLIPLTLSGIGTRDAAIIALYSPFMPAATAAALGLLIILRYLVPAVAGIPFTSHYLGRIRLFGGG